MNRICKYVLLLRAVNVGGNNIIKMQHLRDVFSQEGFLNVQTYIQSGNIVFEIPEANSDKLKQEIRNILKEIIITSFLRYF